MEWAVDMFGYVSNSLKGGFLKQAKKCLNFWNIFLTIFLQQCKVRNVGRYMQPTLSIFHFAASLTWAHGQLNQKVSKLDVIKYLLEYSCLYLHLIWVRRMKSLHSFGEAEFYNTSFLFVVHTSVLLPRILMDLSDLRWKYSCCCRTKSNCQPFYSVG